MPKLLFILLFTSLASHAINIIPYNKKSWTKFEKNLGSNTKTPAIINKNVGGIGIINEEIKPKIQWAGALKECLTWKGVKGKNFCKIQNRNTVSFIFTREYQKGIVYQTVSFDKKYSKAIQKFETDIR